MTVPSLPAIAALPSQDDATITAVLDALFEPSPALHATFLPRVRSSPFASYDALIDGCHAELQALSGDGSSEARTTLYAILGSHPRLGAKKVDSAQSAAEQAKLQAGGEPAELASLNAEYEAAFPGLIYVVFVNGRGRAEIMDNMRARIARGDQDAEVQEAIQVWMVGVVSLYSSPVQWAALTRIFLSRLCAISPRTEPASSSRDGPVRPLGDCVLLPPSASPNSVHVEIRRPCGGLSVGSGQTLCKSTPDQIPRSRDGISSPVLPIPGSSSSPVPVPIHVAIRRHIPPSK